MRIQTMRRRAGGLALLGLLMGSLPGCVQQPIKPMTIDELLDAVAKFRNERNLSACVNVSGVFPGGSATLFARAGSLPCERAWGLVGPGQLVPPMPPAGAVVPWQDIP